MAFRKRVFANAFNASKQTKFKKRKFTRRFRKRGGGKSTSLTTQSGGGRTFGFRSRKISKRSWNKKLWDSTLQKSHYRTTWATGTNALTQASTTSGTVVWLSADDNAAAPFWTVAGGLLAEDTGVTPPLFAGDIIMRGGTMGIIIGNTNDAVDFDNIRVKLWLVKTGDEYDGAAIPTGTTIAFDPSCLADFKSRVGRIVMSREFLLDNNNSAEFKFRHPIQKYDQGDYALGKHRYWWWVHIANANNNLTTTSVRITTYMNASFSGDAIGTT